jgi:hypothetical protein
MCAQNVFAAAGDLLWQSRLDNGTVVLPPHALGVCLLISFLREPLNHVISTARRGAGHAHALLI